MRAPLSPKNSAEVQSSHKTSWCLYGLVLSILLRLGAESSLQLGAKLTIQKSEFDELDLVLGGHGCSQRQDKTSRVFRDYAARQLLANHRSELLAVELHGHIFFGSVVSIIKSIEQQLNLPERLMTTKKNNRAEDTKNEAAAEMRVRYVVLDCSAVTGIDATAAGHVWCY